MNNELNVNSGKKVVILVSILFCTIILLIGATTAYFTQGAGANIENIVTTDELSLEYNDDVNNYMRQELIPSTRENAITAYNRTEEGKKCLDMNDYSACSIYRFSVKNTGNVSQSLIMTLNPTANSYTNLKFILYEITEEGNNLIQDTTDLVKGSTESINLYKSYVLNPNKINTYELVFYIEAKNYDQTLEDSGRQFGAGVKIDSITTGKYVAKNFGANCWNADAGETKTLTEFYGINHVTGEIDEKCSEYVSKTVIKDEETEEETTYYDIMIPSSVGGQEITTLGNKLFSAFDGLNEDDEPIFTKYQFIENIIIEDKIQKIEDSSLENFYGTFFGIGFDIEDPNYNLNIILPKSLTEIGSASFAMTSLTEIIIPANVIRIGNRAFLENYKLRALIFEDSLNGNNFLNVIEEEAFSSCDLTYTKKEAPLILPSGITTMGSEAFDGNSNLDFIYFTESTAGFDPYWLGDADAEIVTTLPEVNE